MRIRCQDGRVLDRVCRYIDECHVEVGTGWDNLYHICQFAEMMERNGNSVIPLRNSLPAVCYGKVPEKRAIVMFERGFDGYRSAPFAAKRGTSRKLVGTPMGIILYRDSEGQTIPQDFVAELDPPPQEFEVIDYAQARLDEAIELINEYCWKEFEQEADFSDLHHIDLAFGSTSDNKYVIEASADLIDFRLVYQVDGEVVMSLQCRDLDDLNVHLANLSFDNMIAYAEEQYEKRQEQPEHPAADTALPHERFTVIETENGYAVWDDVQGGIYVDSEGVQEEFTSEWQAGDYLKQVKRASAEKSAGSSADGRSSNGDIPSPQTQPRRYQVVVYHHIENGMDEKREYETLQEAENVARGYVDGTLEDYAPGCRVQNYVCRWYSDR